jgi:predicted nucleic-acid-binding protein
VAALPRDEGSLAPFDGNAIWLASATRLISRCVAEGSTLFVPVTVVPELEWALRSIFAFGKDEVQMTLPSLFSAAELTFESEQALEIELQWFRQGSADFADRFHVALATQAGEQPLWTFDQGAARLSGARSLAKAGTDRDVAELQTVRRIRVVPDSQRRHSCIAARQQTPSDAFRLTPPRRVA